MTTDLGVINFDFQFDRSSVAPITGRFSNKVLTGQMGGILGLQGFINACENCRAQGKCNRPVVHKKTKT